jgi:hypothetical protein
MSGVWPLGMVSVFPIALMLTLSFFVLAVLENVRKKRLIIFGRVVLVFLWVSVLLTMSTNINGIIRHHKMMAKRRAATRMPRVRKSKTHPQMRKETPNDVQR